MPTNSQPTTTAEKPKRKRRKRKPTSQDSGSVNESTSKEAPPTEEGDAVIYAQPCIQDKDGNEVPLYTTLRRDTAMALLGWVEEPGESNWGEFLLRDRYGKKIRCYNNTINVPFRKSNAELLVQEILGQKSGGKRCWNFNAEPIVIGKTGKVVNGQHTLVGLVLACQDWERTPGKYIHFQEEPTIDKLVVFGVDEDDDTVNTLDTCRGRTQSDVMYRSDFFDGIPEKEKKTLARVCSYAVNTCWERMGASHAFAPRQTFSMAIDFLRQHPRILNAAKHVTVENGDNNIGKYLSPGYAAGLMYLMGCSTTDPKEYLRNPCEDSLDFSNWDKAEEFWTLIGGVADSMKGLRIALSKLLKQEEGGSRKERIALVCKAWEQFARSGKTARIQLKYVEEDGVKTLAEEPTVGGIDLISFSREEE